GWEPRGDRLFAQEPSPRGSKRAHPDVRLLLPPKTPGATAVAAQTTAPALGADPADSDGVAHAAAARAGAPETQAAQTARIARRRAKHVAHGALQLSAQPVVAEDGGDPPGAVAEDPLGHHPRLILVVRIALGSGAGVALGRVLLAHLAFIAAVLGGHLAEVLLLLGQLLQEPVLLDLRRLDQKFDDARLIAGEL